VPQHLSPLPTTKPRHYRYRSRSSPLLPPQTKTKPKPKTLAAVADVLYSRRRYRPQLLKPKIAVAAASFKT
jgi:hypothetical protein